MTTSNEHTRDSSGPSTPKERGQKMAFDWARATELEPSFIEEGLVSKMCAEAIRSAVEAEREACAMLAASPPIGAWFRCPKCRGEKLELTNRSVLFEDESAFPKWKCANRNPDCQAYDITIRSMIATAIRARSQ